MKAMMVDMGNYQRGPLSLNLMDTPTSVDCGREVRFRRSFRSLVECMVPCCGFQPSSPSSSTDSLRTDDDENDAVFTQFTPTVTGTFFGYKKGRVSFCLQEHTRSTSPILLLEFAVPTEFLAREMQHGLLRIALVECEPRQRRLPGLLQVPVWGMHCNGRRVGFAVRRKMSGSDLRVLKQMQSVSVGAGVLPPPADGHAASNGKAGGGEALMYLRATFQRVVGSVDSQSFHMINPVGSSGQELSIFLLRSSS